MPATKTCPSCEAGLADDAVLCLDCGYYLEKKKRLRTKSEGARHAWRTGLSAVEVAVVEALAVFPAMAFEVARDFKDWWLIPLALLAGTVIPLTSGSEVAARRDPNGRWQLTLRRWLCVKVVSSRTIDLARYDALYTDFAAGGEESGDTYTLELRGDRVPPVVIYRGTNEVDARELMDLMQYQAGLRIERM